MPREEHMLVAISAAERARAEGDYAVGSALARDGEVISSAGNRTHIDGDATQHAEMIVIRNAARLLGTKRLSGSVLYSTHEPCPMCMSAAIWARVSTVVFGATMEDHKRFSQESGNVIWPWRVIDIPAAEVVGRSTAELEVVSGFMRDACLKLFHA